MKNYLFIIIFSVLMYSCKPEPQGFKYNWGTFPAEPVNLDYINSEYEDYNSTILIIGDFIPFCFSSTRNSQGADFDIVYKSFKVDMDRRNGIITVGEDMNQEFTELAQRYNSINNALAKINTPSNEFGPYFIPDSRNHYKLNPLFILMYSNNKDGSQDIRYVQNLDAFDTYTEPKPVAWLNSAKDDAYPTLKPDSTAIYFCSDREGNFDIYKALLDKSKSLRLNLEDTTAKPISKESILCSESNDKCPFILDSLMVFTSDRSGGFGGFDLYYSTFKNGQWSAPVNFGQKINTQYDEYRPIVTPIGGFTNNFMIFSSNRPGGKGGFDLYYAGVDKIMKN